MKTVALSEESWRKLKELKEKMGFRSFNELIEMLIETWHLSSLKEELSRMELSFDFEDAKKFITDARRPVKKSSAEAGTS
ncbi:MAG: ribbon-helix-helix protein, CopG family [Thermofilum sp.]